MSANSIVKAPPVSRHPEYYNVMHALNGNGIRYRYLIDIFRFQPQTWRDDEAVHMIELGYAHYERRTVWALVKE